MSDQASCTQQVGEFSELRTLNSDIKTEAQAMEKISTEINNSKVWEIIPQSSHRSRRPSRRRQPSGSLDIPDNISTEILEINGSRVELNAILDTHGWVTVESVKMPYVVRGGVQKFIPLCIIEKTLLKPYPGPYPEKELGRAPMMGFYLATEEVRLFNRFVNQLYTQRIGLGRFSLKDMLVTLPDFIDFYQKVKSITPLVPQVVEVAKSSPTPKVLGGWSQVNNTIVPYVLRNRVKMVPLSVVRYAAGLLNDVDIPSLEANQDECDYLNSSCKGQGMNFEFHEHTRLLELFLVPTLSNVRVTINELPKNDPLTHARFLNRNNDRRSVFVAASVQLQEMTKTGNEKTQPDTTTPTMVKKEIQMPENKPGPLASPPTHSSDRRTDTTPTVGDKPSTPSQPVDIPHPILLKTAAPPMVQHPIVLQQASPPVIHQAAQSVNPPGVHIVPIAAQSTSVPGPTIQIPMPSPDGKAQMIVTNPSNILQLPASSIKICPKHGIRSILIPQNVLPPSPQIILPAEVAPPNPQMNVPNTPRPPPPIMVIRLNKPLNTNTSGPIVVPGSILNSEPIAHPPPLNTSNQPSTQNNGENPNKSPVVIKIESDDEQNNMMPSLDNKKVTISISDREVQHTDKTKSDSVLNETEENDVTRNDLHIDKTLSFAEEYTSPKRMRLDNQGQDDSLTSTSAVESLKQYRFYNNRESNVD